MPSGPMLAVASAANEIQAQIIGARLGAEGFVWELRPTVGAPYSVGAVEVLVESERLAEARELLLADEVESVFDDADDEVSGHDGGLWLVIGAVVLLGAFVVVRLMSLG
ncbi:MAG: hypothetical protein AAGK32_10910 [Actinomycetota bacterium]